MRFHSKAVRLGISDPFCTQIYRYNTGSEYGAAAVNMYESKEASQDAKNAENAANYASKLQQQKMYDANQAMLKPYTEAGQMALNEIMALMGKRGGGGKYYTPEEEQQLAALQNKLKSMPAWQKLSGNRNYEKVTADINALGRKRTPEEVAALRSEAQEKAFGRFRADPGYQNSLDTANQAYQRSAMAKGNLFSGNFAEGLSKMNQGLADQQYGNYFNRLWNTANMGRGTASGVAQMNTQFGGDMANFFNRQGQNEAGNIWNQSNAKSTFANRASAENERAFGEALDTAGSLGGAYLSGGTSLVGGKKGGNNYDPNKWKLQNGDWS